MIENCSVAAVLPCYKSRSQVMNVIAAIPDFFDWIIVVDDACPEGTGDFISENSRDPRLRILKLEKNTGVGGAVIAGYQEALKAGAQICVKIDSDGQMDPALSRQFIKPIVDGRADYTKGNRFHSRFAIKEMPLSRLIGNAGLSFMTKLSSGYWSMLDPTNGYTAISYKTLQKMDLSRVERRFFFESDLLMHLYLARAKIVDVPMAAVYGDEKSNLKVTPAIFSFFWKNTRNFARRFWLRYMLQDFSPATLFLVFGLIMLFVGSWVGLDAWISSYTSGKVTAPGTAVLFAILIILGVQFVLQFLTYDYSSEPSEADPIEPRRPGS